MLIQHQQSGEGGRFFLSKGEDTLAEMTYVRSNPHTLVIDHTEVAEELRGQNVGYELVDAAVEYARAEKLKIIPVCVFAAAVFQKKKEYGDVLKVE